MYPEIAGGMVFVTLGMMQIGPVMDPMLAELSPFWQDTLNLAGFVGGLSATIGCLLGTRVLPFTKPSQWPHIAGLILILICCCGYGWAAAWPASPWLALSGFAVFIGLGSARALADFLVHLLNDRKGPN